MKYEEIIKLLNAGYSREEILAMKDDETKAPEKETSPDLETKDSETPETEMSELVKEMREAFSEMKKEFTAFNIMSSRQPETEKEPEDIIANIINPTRKKKGE